MDMLKYLLLLWFLLFCILCALGFSENTYGMPKKDIVYSIMNHCQSERQCKLMLAIAEVESNMNPKAVGLTGDYGLFQITEIGAKEAHIQCPDLSHISAEYLVGKVTPSIKLVMCLLNRLDELHNGNLIDVIIAYNAGTGIAARWRKNDVDIPVSAYRYALKVLDIYIRRFDYDKIN